MSVSTVASDCTCTYRYIDCEGRSKQLYNSPRDTLVIRTRLFKGWITVLSISFIVEVPTGKEGGSLFFECQRRELPRGSGDMPPQKILKFRWIALKYYFQRFPDSIWA